MVDKVSPVEALSPASRAWGQIEPHSSAPRWGMVVDRERCIGCWSCAVICKSENDIPLGMWWNRILTESDELDQPIEVRGGALEMHCLPLACQHCENAPCVKVCPVQATYHRDDGLVMQVRDRVFAAKVKEHSPQVVGMSGLLTTSIPVMGRTVQALADSGLRDKVKIIAGGGVVGEVDASRIGADFTTSNANEGVRMISEWTRKRG